MARTLSVLALGLLYSLGPVSCIKTRVSGVDEAANEALTTSGPKAPAPADPNLLLQAECGRLTLGNGLRVGEKVKVTSNGWTKEDEDFFVNIVTDVTFDADKLGKIENGGGNGDNNAGGNTEGTAGEEKPKLSSEKTPMPLVGLRILGKHDDEGDKKGPGAAVLLFDSDGEPTETLLDTPAGPTRPFMVLFDQATPTEMIITVFTFMSEMSSTGVEGTWHTVSVTVGFREYGGPVTVTVSDCSARYLRVYASATAALFTLPSGACDKPDAALVRLTPKDPANKTSSSTDDGELKKPEPSDGEHTDAEPVKAGPGDAGKPTEGEPTENGPAENGPAENKPAGNEPAENEPVEDELTESEPEGDGHLGGETAGNEPATEEA